MTCSASPLSSNVGGESFEAFAFFNPDLRGAACRGGEGNKLKGADEEAMVPDQQRRNTAERNATEEMKERLDDLRKTYAVTGCYYLVIVLY